jgi:hypothetical protein
MQLDMCAVPEAETVSQIQTLPQEMCLKTRDQAAFQADKQTELLPLV